MFLIRERPHPNIGIKRAWSLAGLPNRYWRLITIIGLFGLVNFPDTLLLLRAKDLGYDFSGVVALLAFKLLCLESGYSSTGAPRPRK